MSGVNLKLFRQRLGLTQAKTARQLGVAPNTFARWERGELPIPEWVTQLLSRMAENTQSGSVVTRPEGIVLDPHHKAILEGLQGHLDWDVFEACAVELVRKDGLSVVAVPGGSDDGFDGAVADPDGEPFPLIGTTGKDALGNLRRNLKTLRRQGWRAEKAIFATSRRLRGDTRRKLRDEARDFGVTLVQAYDQDWFAYRLYENPAWCKRLLGLTGRPRALSAFPNTKRPVLGDAVLGREQEMQWLIDRQRDCLLVGGPGSGKTFLLRALVMQGQALFLVDDNREQIANDLRELKPPAVIIDDAHVHPELIDTFMQIRKEIGAENVRIVASCWPNDASDVRTALNLTDEDVNTLNLLDADTIIGILKSVGLNGRNELLAYIREQSAGRPGLAATLAYLCLTGDIGQVVSGQAVLNQLVGGASRILDSDARKLLAPFALAGDEGARQDEVAKYLGISRLEVSRDLAVLAAAGIVRERHHRSRSDEPASISVEPEPMRWVLVRDVFFGGADSLDHRPLLELLGNRKDTIETLIGAQSRGADVPSLLSLLESVDSPELWSHYASLGRSKAAYVIDHHPEIIQTIAGSGLSYFPEKVIPMLLAKVQRRDYRSLIENHGTLNEIQQWVDGALAATSADDITGRRIVLIRETKRWWKGSQRDHVAIHAMCMALMPETEHIFPDPGSGSKITIRRYAYPKPVLERLSAHWPSVLELIHNSTEVPWNDLLRLISTWYYGGNRAGQLPENIQSMKRGFAKRMLLDIAAASRNHPGVQSRIREETSRLKLNIELDLDPDFEAVYPEMLTYNSEEHAKLTRILAKRLNSRSIEDVAALLKRIEEEANLAEMRTPSPVLPEACMLLAEMTTDPLPAAATLMECKLPGYVIQPFLQRACAENFNGWRALVHECLQGNSYERVAVSTIMTHPESPADLLSEAMPRARKLWDSLRWLFNGDRVPDKTLETFLYSDDARLAATAAIVYWVKLRERCMDGPHGKSWRRAIVGATFDDLESFLLGEYRFGQILSSDGELAVDWLVSTLRRDQEWSSLTNLNNTQKEVVEEAIDVLSLDQRRRVLKELPPGLVMPPFEIARMLLGDDLGLYREMLESADLADYHLGPLGGDLNSVWVTKARVAFEAGKTIDEIVDASYRTEGFTVWGGSESRMWGGRRLAFENLKETYGSDPDIRNIAQQGIELMGRREKAAKEREHLEAVYGT